MVWPAPFKLHINMFYLQMWNLPIIVQSAAIPVLFLWDIWSNFKGVGVTRTVWHEHLCVVVCSGEDTSAWHYCDWLKALHHQCNIFPISSHPGLAEIFAPDGVPGSDIMENFRQWEDNSWVQDGFQNLVQDGVSQQCWPKFQSDFKQILGARLCRVQQPAKNSHYQSKVFVCVSVISGRVRIIARRRSIGF